MNINDCGKSLLNYFTLEERSIPDSATYPGRNAEVIRALNAAGQDLFGKGKPWCRKQPRGAMVNAPVTVEMTVTEGSSVATIPVASYQQWFTGCMAKVGSNCSQNRIKSGTINPPVENPLRLQVSLPDLPGFGPLDFEASQPLGEDGGLGFWIASGVGPNEDLDVILVHESEGEHVGKWSFRFEVNSSPLTGIFWRTTDAVESPLAAAGWEPVGFSPGEPGDVTVTSADPQTASITLQNPYIGESGTIQATIYHDSIDLSSDVLEVHEPVLFNCHELRPHNTAKGSRATPRRDYGFWPSALGRGSSKEIGCPEFFHVENVVVTSTAAPAKRLRLIPAPTAKGVVEYEAMLTPPRVTSLSSTDDLPIPFEFVESIFLPIAVKKLRGGPFWAGIIGDSQVDSDYKAALELLAESEPQRRSGIRFVPRI